MTAPLLVELTRRLHAHPPRLFDRARAELDRHDKRLEVRLREALESRRRAFGIAVGKLEAMSPLAVLERGYSLTRTPDGGVVTDAGAGGARRPGARAPAARRARLRSTIRRPGPKDEGADE